MMRNCGFEEQHEIITDHDRSSQCLPVFSYRDFKWENQSVAYIVRKQIPHDILISRVVARNARE